MDGSVSAECARELKDAVERMERHSQQLIDADATHPTTVHDAAVRYVDSQIEVGELITRAVEEKRGQQNPDMASGETP